MKSRSRRVKRTKKTKRSKRTRARVSLSKRRKSKKKTSRKSIKIKKYTSESSSLPKQLLFSGSYSIVHFSPTLFIIPENKDFNPVRINREELYVNYPYDGKVYPDHPVFQKYPDHWIMYKTATSGGYDYVVIQTKDRVGIYAYGSTTVPHELSKRYRSFFNKYIQTSPLYNIEYSTITLLKEVSYKSVLPGLDLPDNSPNNNGTSLMIELVNNDYLLLIVRIYKLNFNSIITHYYSHKSKADGVDVFWFDDKGYLYIYDPYHDEIIKSNKSNFTNKPEDLLKLNSGFDRLTWSYNSNKINWPAWYDLDYIFSPEELNNLERINAKSLITRIL